MSKALLIRVNADLLASLCDRFKLDSAVDKGKQSVVRSATNIVTGMDLGTALANKDIAGENRLTVRSLYAETLRFTVASVLGRTDAFFMCEKLDTDSKHGNLSLHIIRLLSLHRGIRSIPQEDR